jgi:NIMA (never in mitosis gene a)-related kinase
MSRRYKILKILGEGSFGKAYLCENLQDNSNCVIKQIILDTLDEKEKKETLNEVLILKKLDHSNIIKFLDAFTRTKPNTTLNIVMEYADGGDLNHKIKKQREKKSPLTENEIINYLTQICLALNHMHKKKVIHRDLKSGNVFLTKSGLVKLGDFGISKGFKNTWEKARTKVGTPYYLSPEIINSKPYDSKSDIWALGVLLYEMMTFRMPFNASSFASLSLKIMKGFYQTPPSSYSKDLIDLVKKCLNMDPKKRPSAENILKLPFIQKRIFGYLNEVQYNEDLSITIIKKYREKREIEKKRRLKIMDNKRNENNVNIRKSLNKDNAGTDKKNLEKNFESDKNKVMKFFKKRNSANNIVEPNDVPKKKEKETNILQKYKIMNNDENKIKKEIKTNHEEKKEQPINFLQANKLNIKHIKIVDRPSNNEEQKKNEHPEFQNMYKNEKTANEGLNDLINDYMGNELDLNKINEDQYNQIRYLNNLSRLIKEEKQNEEEGESETTESLNKINEESIQNENESVNFDDIKINVENKKIGNENNINKEEINQEYKEIQELKKKIISEIGDDIFKMVYNHVDSSTDKTEIKFDMEKIAQKLSNEFQNNKYNKKKLNLAIEKLPEIFVILIQDRLMKYNI